MGEYRKRRDVERGPGIDNPVGIDQGRNAGIATERGIEPGVPPRLAGYGPYPPDPELDATGYDDDEDLPAGTKTGEQPFLREGEQDGERHGPTMVSREDLEHGPRIGDPDEPVQRDPWSPT